MTTKPNPSMVSANLPDWPGNLPSGRVGGKKIYRTANPTDTDLFYAMTEITGFRKEFETTVAGVVFLTFSADIIHRGISIGGDSNYPIGVGARTIYRAAASQAGLAAASQINVPYAYSAGNIASLTDHYGHMIFARVPFAINPGWHRFGITMTGHSSVAPGTDGLAELNGTAGSDYNYFLMEFEEGLVIE